MLDSCLLLPIGFFDPFGGEEQGRSLYSTANHDSHSLFLLISEWALKCRLPSGPLKLMNYQKKYLRIF